LRLSLLYYRFDVDDGVNNDDVRDDDDDDDDDDVFCTVTRRRCMLSSQPGPFSINDFLASVAKKKKKGKLKLEYSV